MPSRVISRAAASSAPGAGNLGLVHVRITRVTARRPVSYGMSCSASNHADTWPGRSVSGLLSMASHKRLNSCAACSRVTTSHPLVLSFPLVSTGQNHRDGVVVRRPRVRSSPGAQVVRGADAVVVPVAENPIDVGHPAFFGVTGSFCRRYRLFDCGYYHVRSHLLADPGC